MTRLIIAKVFPRPYEIHSELKGVRAALDLESRWLVRRLNTWPDDVWVEFRGITGPRIDHQDFIDGYDTKGSGKHLVGGATSQDVNILSRFLSDVGKVYANDRARESELRLIAMDSRGYQASTPLPILTGHPAPVTVSKFVNDGKGDAEIREIAVREAVFDSRLVMAMRTALEAALPERSDQDQELSPLEVGDFFRASLGEVGTRLLEHAEYGRTAIAGEEWLRPGELADPAHDQIRFVEVMHGGSQAHSIFDPPEPATELAEQHEPTRLQESSESAGLQESPEPTQQPEPTDESPFVAPPWTTPVKSSGPSRSDSPGPNPVDGPAPPIQPRQPWWRRRLGGSRRSQHRPE